MRHSVQNVQSVQSVQSVHAVQRPTSTAPQLGYQSIPIIGPTGAVQFGIPVQTTGSGGTAVQTAVATGGSGAGGIMSAVQSCMVPVETGVSGITSTSTRPQVTLKICIINLIIETSLSNYYVGSYYLIPSAPTY